MDLFCVKMIFVRYIQFVLICLYFYSILEPFLLLLSEVMICLIFYKISLLKAESIFTNPELYKKNVSLSSFTN